MTRRLGLETPPVPRLRTCHCSATRLRTRGWPPAKPGVTLVIMLGALATKPLGSPAEVQIEEAIRSKIRILSPLDEDYPKLLSATKDDPCILYVMGRLALSPQNSVAIIGTRQPTETGLEVTRRITEFFVEQSWSIVSGLALGCDAMAHSTTLKRQGHTVAVLAHGLQTISPARHHELAAQIVDGGGTLISEFPLGRDALLVQFVQRDRTQAGLARGVVMVQSDLDGGSLHASRAALNYTRWLAVVYPTASDLDSLQTRANKLLSDGDLPQKLDLLRCGEEALRRLFILRDRKDLARLLEPMALI